MVMVKVVVEEMVLMKKMREEEDGYKLESSWDLISEALPGFLRLGELKKKGGGKRPGEVSQF